VNIFFDSKYLNKNIEIIFCEQRSLDRTQIHG
jgi:hypothetical protein